jgi:hypothetical protein
MSANSAMYVTSESGAFMSSTVAVSSGEQGCLHDFNSACNDERGEVFANATLPAVLQVTQLCLRYCMKRGEIASREVNAYTTSNFISAEYDGDTTLRFLWCNDHFARPRVVRQLRWVFGMCGGVQREWVPDTDL